MVSLLSTRAVTPLPKLGFRGGFAPVRWICCSLVEASLLPIYWGFRSSSVSKPVHPCFPTTSPHHRTKPHCTTLHVPSSPILSYLSPLACLVSRRRRQIPKPQFQICYGGISACIQPKDFGKLLRRAPAKSMGIRSSLLRPETTVGIAPQGTFPFALPLILLPFAALRFQPPPEPPPCSKTELGRRLSYPILEISNRTPIPSHGLLETPPSVSAPTRPPPKPPWIVSRLYEAVYDPNGLGWLLL